MFGMDPNKKPSVKKILIYCIVISSFFILLGFIGERVGWVSVI